MEKLQKEIEAIFGEFENKKLSKELLGLAFRKVNMLSMRYTTGEIDRAIKERAMEDMKYSIFTPTENY